MSEKKKPAQSMDMQFARPKKSVCQTCKYRKKDTVIKKADGSEIVIQQWSNAECDKYEEKPMGIVFDDEGCVFYEKD